MKTSIKTLIILAILIVLSSCNKNDDLLIIEDNLLIGSWSESVYENGTIIFKRVKEIPEAEYSLTFKQEDSLFIEKTSGWCGTPPLTFFNIKGTWKIEKDILKIYDINIPNFEGAKPVLLYNFKIISLTEEKLILERELTEQEKEYKELMNVYDDFYKMIVGKNCIDSNDWSFVGYGKKACGGCQGYIAYPNSIDVNLFLEKVTNYTNLEDAFNKKWKIFSDCSLVAEPKKVVCKDGYPTLEY